MRKLLLILLYTLFTATAQAQNDKASADFIGTLVNSNEKIIYTDSISNYAISFIKEGLNRSITHDSQKEKTELQLLSFTRKEKEYINKELSKMQKFRWKDSLLNNSLLIKQDTINAIFNKRLFDGWGYFHSRYGQGFYEFSNPIFLRNHTMCIFYKGYSCGSLCGEGDLTVYVNEKGKWIRKCLLSSWIS